MTPCTGGSLVHVAGTEMNNDTHITEQYDNIFNSDITISRLKYYTYTLCLGFIGCFVL